MSGRRSEGQALVELIAMAPLVLFCGVLGLQALLAGANFVSADNAAHAAALTRQMGGDAELAANAAVPGWSNGRVRTDVRGRLVRVRLTPRAIVPPLAHLLEVESQAWVAR